MIYNVEWRGGPKEREVQVEFLEVFVDGFCILWKRIND